MVVVLRSKKYVEGRVLIETDRVLNPQFKSTVVEVSGAQLEILRNLMMYPNQESTFVSTYENQHYLMPTVDEWNILSAVVADLEEKLMLIYVDDYVCIRDVKEQNVPGGDFASGDWRTRDITEELADDAGICTIDGNQITLQAGTYRCSISVPANKVNMHQAQLYNITDDSVTLVGTPSRSDTAHYHMERSWIIGPFTIASQKVFEIQHQCQTTQNSNGLGLPGNFTDEVYTIAEFRRTLG